jgi:lincosamide nucleotidyltransferase A/C/D/E
MSKKTRNLTASDVLEILAWLEAAEVEIWLDGGWGHDALLGEQTRQTTTSI